MSFVFLEAKANAGDSTSATEEKTTPAPAATEGETGGDAGEKSTDKEGEKAAEDGEAAEGEKTEKSGDKGKKKKKEKEKKELVTQSYLKSTGSVIVTSR